MKKAAVILLMFMGPLAAQADFSIAPVGDWKVEVVRERTGITEVLGEPYAIITHPALPNGYRPGITVHKLALPARFNDLNVTDWRETTLKERTERKSIDIERLNARGNSRRYIAEIRFDQKAENPTQATYMAIRINKAEMLVFKFIADREFYLAALDAVRSFMNSTRVDFR